MHLLILHIAYVFGGAERTTANLLSHLDRTRITRITLVAPNVLRPLLPDVCDQFIPTDSCSLEGGFTTARRLCQDARAVGELLGTLAPDVALGMMHYPSALVVLGARMAGVRTRTIASYRGPFYEYMRHYEHHLRRRWFLRTTVAATAWLADRVIVPSHGTALELRRHFLHPLRRTVTIPNGIDLAEVAKRPVTELTLPDHWQHEPTLPILCAMARLAPEKNLGLLLDAFRHIHTLRPARLMILGDGPERASLETQISAWGLSDAIWLPGHQKDIYPFLRRAEVFIHTCQFEGFGYAVLEALACGVAVVATDCPYGPREILGNNEYGVLTPPNDPAALASAILQLLADPPARHALAERGLQRAHQLSIERMVRAYETVFTEQAR